MPDAQLEQRRGARSPARRTTAGKVAAALALLLGVVYLVNPTAGVVELIPDVLPFVGNLDEATATGLVIWGLSYYGIDIFRAQQPDRKE